MNWTYTCHPPSSNKNNGIKHNSKMYWTNYTITLHKALPLPMKIHKNCTHVYNIYHTHSSTKTHYLQFLIRWDLGLEKLLALVFSGNFLLSVPFPGVPHPLKSRTRCSVCVFTKQIYIYNKCKELEIVDSLRNNMKRKGRHGSLY